MTNYRRLSLSRPALLFVITNSSFFRHSSLGIRHLRAANSTNYRLGASWRPCRAPFFRLFQSAYGSVLPARIPAAFACCRRLPISAGSVWSAGTGYVVRVAALRYCCSKPRVAVIHASNLTKYYGDYAAIRDVSFEVPQGKIVGFLGPNGAGKTTTLRILAGYLTATSGR